MVQRSAPCKKRKERGTRPSRTEREKDGAPEFTPPLAVPLPVMLPRRR